MVSGGVAVEQAANNPAIAPRKQVIFFINFPSNIVVQLNIYINYFLIGSILFDFIQLSCKMKKKIIKSGAKMFDLFYTLFKYKEKAQKDELGYYPEKVDVKAFPERRYLWTSRFFVVVSCLSLCVSMILGGALCIIIPMKKVQIMPLQIDYKRYQVTKMSSSQSIAFAGDLVTESIMADYITKRYTIGDNFDEMNMRLGENEFVFLASDTPIYRAFEATERPYFEMLQKSGIRREVKIDMIYPVSFDFWQVRFRTIDSAKNLSQGAIMELTGINEDNVPKETYESKEPLISSWIATMRMKFNSAKYDNKDLGLINPFGITINSYDLNYMGNNVKSRRE